MRLVLLVGCARAVEEHKSDIDKGTFLMCGLNFSLSDIVASIYDNAHKTKIYCWSDNRK